MHDIYTLFVSTTTSLKHDHPNTASFLLVNVVLHINSTGDCTCTVVEQIEMQLTVSRAEFLRFEEERVVKKGESIEHVEIVLPRLSARLPACR